MSARDEFATIYKSRLNPNTNTPMQINVFWQTMFPRFSKGYQAGLEAAAKVCDEKMEHYKGFNALADVGSMACAAEIRKLKDGEV